VRRQQRTAPNSTRRWGGISLADNIVGEGHFFGGNYRRCEAREKEVSLIRKRPHRVRLTQRPGTADERVIEDVPALLTSEVCVFDAEPRVHVGDLAESSFFDDLMEVTKVNRFDGSVGSLPPHQQVWLKPTFRLSTSHSVDEMPAGAVSGVPPVEREESAPVVFVSYTHEDPAHKAWVRTLAADLRGGGVNAILDQWELRLGTDLTLFMESGIRKSDRVLLVCTPVYARKANEGEGGVGYERLVVTGELAKNIATEKFICVLRRGTKNVSIPTFAQTRLYVDFTDDANYRTSLEQLLRDIHNAPSEPKPLLGANPFRRESQGVTTPAVTVVPKPADLANVSEVARAAVQMLREKDLLGWKHLVRSVRQEQSRRLLDWRCNAEAAANADDAWLSHAHDAVEAAAPLIVLALTAAESDIAEVRAQRSLLDDLLAPRNWSRGGQRRIAAMPEGIAMVYHHLLGSYFLDNGDQASALELLRTVIEDPAQPQRTSELWQQHQLMGWTYSLKHDCEVAWGFLKELPDAHGWLGDFFLDASSFRTALCGYQCLASLLELSWAVARKEKLEDVQLQVPPMFVVESAASTAVRKAVPNQAALDRIAQAYGTDEDLVRRAWPTWQQVLEDWHRGGGRPFFGLIGRLPDLIPTTRT